MWIQPVSRPQRHRHCCTGGKYSRVLSLGNHKYGDASSVNACEQKSQLRDVIPISIFFIDRIRTRSALSRAFTCVTQLLCVCARHDFDYRGRLSKKIWRRLITDPRLAAGQEEQRRRAARSADVSTGPWFGSKREENLLRLLTCRQMTSGRLTVGGEERPRVPAARHCVRRSAERDQRYPGLRVRDMRIARSRSLRSVRHGKSLLFGKIRDPSTPLPSPLPYLPPPPPHPPASPHCYLLYNHPHIYKHQHVYAVVCSRFQRNPSAHTKARRHARSFASPHARTPAHPHARTPARLHARTPTRTLASFFAP